jgi:hypothetical protein
MGFFPLIIALDMKKTRIGWQVRIRVLFIV